MDEVTRKTRYKLGELSPVIWNSLDLRGLGGLQAVPHLYSTNKLSWVTYQRDESPFQNLHVAVSRTSCLSLQKGFFFFHQSVSPTLSSQAAGRTVGQPV
jgi:hypothetical protein